jgi:hypothetical protein
MIIILKNGIKSIIIILISIHYLIIHLYVKSIISIIIILSKKYGIKSIIIFWSSIFSYIIIIILSKKYGIKSIIIILISLPDYPFVCKIYYPYFFSYIIIIIITTCNIFYWLSLDFSFNDTNICPNTNMLTLSFIISFYSPIYYSSYYYY